MASTMTEESIRKTLEIFKDDDALIEVRAVNKPVLSGYYRDREKLIKDVLSYSDRTWFFVLNTINNGCYAREQCERILKSTYGAELKTTNKGDITRLNWVLIDADPVRPTGVSSSKDEKLKAAKTIKRVYDYLNQVGFSDPVIADSGNGYHLVYPIDLPTKASSEIQKFLQALDMLFSDDYVKIDTSVFNPNRVTKLYGTIARKGASTEERPHRASGILKVPDNIKPNSLDLIKKVSSKLPKPEKRSYSSTNIQSNFSIDDFIQNHGIAVERDTETNGRRKIVLEHCPFDENHRAPDSALFIEPSGAIGFNCFHNSCQDKSWKDVRLLFEPDCYDKRSRRPEPRYSPPKTTRTASAEAGAELEPPDFSDSGFSEVFCRTNGDTAKWTPGGGWHVFDGKIWQCSENAVINAATDLAFEMLEDAKQKYVSASTAVAKAIADAAGSDDQEAAKPEIARLTKEVKQAQSYLRFARHSRDSYPIGAMLKLAKAKLEVPDDTFDANPNLICVNNGILNLQTETLQPFEPGYYISKKLNTDFVPDVDTSEVMTFLKQIFEDDPAKIPYLLRTIGYSLSGIPREDKMFVWHGETSRNGKTTLATMISSTFGELATTIPADALGVNRFANGNAPKPALMSMAGRRIIFAEEPSQNMEIDCGLLKTLTGSGAISARQLKQRQVTFKMKGPLVTICNNLPIINDYSVFASNRIQVLPFEVHFRESEQNKTLKSVLTSPRNRSALLKLALEGLKEYREIGLSPPLSVENATRAYSEKPDMILDFINAMTVPGNGVTVKETYIVFCTWAAAAGLPVLRKGEFIAGLKDHSLTRDRATVNGTTQTNVLIGRQLKA